MTTLQQNKTEWMGGATSKDQKRSLVDRLSTCAQLFFRICVNPSDFYAFLILPAPP